MDSLLLLIIIVVVVCGGIIIILSLSMFLSPNPLALEPETQTH